MGEASGLLDALRQLGLRGVSTLQLTGNRTVMVSFRDGVLRLHRGYIGAPSDVLHAIVLFVNGPAAARRTARARLLSHPVTTSPCEPRPVRPHPDDQALADRLREAHARLNAERFGGELNAVMVGVSRRMRSRLGHFRPPPVDGAPAEIVISRRHLRRHGWREALETLLHEMVHQWQHEQAMPVDHGPAFRAKARTVGIAPRARRTA
jgi:hypothetical protein